MVVVSAECNTVGLVIILQHTVITKGKVILIIGKGPVQRLDDTMLKAETEYSINFTELEKAFCLYLYYNAF